MEWRGGRESSNVEDRRGASGKVVGGGIGAVIIALIGYFLGINPSGDGGSPQQPPDNGGMPQNTRTVDPAQDTLKHFVSAVLAQTEDVWTEIFNQEGKRYTDPHLVLFTDRVRSACGMAGSASGPFYCPEDARVYIDLSFYQELRQRFGAPGDFAQAYVIAHEVGHHVQNLLGISDHVRQLQQQTDERGANELSVRLELQADFFAGVWAHYEKEKGKLDPGDIDEALNAASQIGDDKLQQESQGYVVPDAFTHGTSAQRSRWFKKGYETGDPNQGDTFSARTL